MYLSESYHGYLCLSESYHGYRCEKYFGYRCQRVISRLLVGQRVINCLFVCVCMCHWVISNYISVCHLIYRDYWCHWVIYCQCQIVSVSHLTATCISCIIYFNNEVICFVIMSLVCNVEPLFQKVNYISNIVVLCLNFVANDTQLLVPLIESPNSSYRWDFFCIKLLLVSVKLFFCGLPY